MPLQKIIVLFVGSDADNGFGGISTALPGYFNVLAHLGIGYQFIASHQDSSGLNKLKVDFRAFYSVACAVLLAKKRKRLSILYMHIGPWFSMLRKLSLILVAKMLHRRERHYYAGGGDRR